MSERSASASPESESFRLEAFSDAVFAFAATLLVVALEVPDSFEELEKVLFGFVPFTLSFLALVLIWSVHRRLFLRFPMGDRTTMVLNSALLFVVLFYVYPLKFLTRAIASMFVGAELGGGRIETFENLAKLFVWYGAGFAAIFLLVALLYRHAARRAPAMGRAGGAVDEARFLARHYSIFVFVALLSIAMSVTGIGLRVAAPGWIYGFLGPLCALHGIWNARRARRRASIPNSDS
jgi:uncharacterized membrane protein